MRILRISQSKESEQKTKGLSHEHSEAAPFLCAIRKIGRREKDKYSTLPCRYFTKTVELCIITFPNKAKAYMHMLF